MEIIGSILLMFVGLIILYRVIGRIGLIIGMVFSAGVAVLQMMG